MSTFTLIRHPEHLAVVRLGPGSDIPSWAGSGTLLSITATAEETSIVCGAADVPRKSRSEGPFLAYAVEGPLDFSLTGVLAALLAPLASAGVSVFTISTFDTDWILIPEGGAAAAERAWQDAGHIITPAGGSA